MAFLHRGAVLTAVVAAGAGLALTATVPSGPHSPDSMTFAVAPAASASLEPGAAAADAGAAVAAAVADNPPWWDDVVGFGQYQIDEGLGYLSDGDLPYGLAVVSAGLANVFVYEIGRASCRERV